MANESGDMGHQEARKTNLDLVNECDNFPYQQKEPGLYAQHMSTYFHLLVADHAPTYGLLLPSVAAVFRGVPNWNVDEEARTLTLEGGSTREERSRIVAQTVLAMRETGHFEILKGWRNELYPVFDDRGEIIFEVERAASALLGIVTYGCHMTAYIRPKHSQNDVADMKFCIPRRAKAKSTYPGMLDNTVAGGTAVGETPFESLVRESDEEASLGEDLVRSRTKHVGCVTYFHIRDERAGGETKLLQPECQFVYDLELDEDEAASLKPSDGDDEVESFSLMTLQEVQHHLASGEFKPNCALVLLDFFMRHGIITSDTDKDYVEIQSRLKRYLGFPTRRITH